MNRLRIERGAGVGEPVHVWSAHGDRLPSEFVWRGRRYRVRSLQVARGESPGLGSSGRRFQVRTTSGLTCVLTHDVAGGGWRMDRLVSSGGGQ